MANRYRRGRSRTPDPDVTLSTAMLRSATSPALPRARLARRSLGGWGSTNSLDNILSNLQESIQQKHRDVCNSFESLDALQSDNSDEGGIQVLEPKKNETNSGSVGSGALYPSGFDKIINNEDKNLLNQRTSRRILPNVEHLSNKNKHISDIGFKRTNHDTTDVSNQSNLTNELGGFGLLSNRAESGIIDGKDTVRKWLSSDHNILISEPPQKPPRSKNLFPKRTDLTEDKFHVNVSPSQRLTSDNSPVSDPVITYPGDNNNNDGPQYNPRFSKPSQTFRPTKRVFPSIAKPGSHVETTSPLIGRLDRSISKETTDDGMSSALSTCSVTSSSSYTSRVESSGSNQQGGQHAVKRHGAVSPSRSRWNKSHRDPILLMQSADDKNQDKVGDNLLAGGRSNYSPPHSPDHLQSNPAQNRLADKSQGSQSRRLWGSPERCPTTSPVAEEDSHNKSYAFYVPYADENQISTQKLACQDFGDKTELTEEERAVKFPQWVIPFIDDRLTGEFEYRDEQRSMMRKRSRSVPRLRSVGAPQPKEQIKLKPTRDTGPIAPPRNKRTNYSTDRKSRDHSRITSPPPKVISPTPRPPPRTNKKTVETPGTAKKKLPQPPSHKSAPASPISEGCELFPIHYVQHPKVAVVTPTKLSKSKGLSSPASSSSAVGAINSESKTELSVPARNLPKSNLASRRAKSMDNLAFLSSSQKKDPLSSQASRGAFRQQSATSKPKSTTEAQKGAQYTKIQPTNSTKDPTKSNTSGAKSSRPPIANPRKDRTSSVSSTDSRESSSISNRSRSAGRGNSIVLNPAVTRTGGRSNVYGRQESTGSESGNSGNDGTRSRSVSVSSNVSSVSRESWRSTAINTTSDSDSRHSSTLPRNKRQSDAAATHHGGYGTLRASRCTTPIKSILKTNGSSTSMKSDDSTQSSSIDTTKSPRRALPKVPQDVVIETRTLKQTGLITRDSLYKRQPKEHKDNPTQSGLSNLAKSRARSMDNLNVTSTSSRSKQKVDSRPMSPPSSRGTQADTRRMRSKSPAVPRSLPPQTGTPRVGGVNSQSSATNTSGSSALPRGSGPLPHSSASTSSHSSSSSSSRLLNSQSPRTIISGRSTAQSPGASSTAGRLRPRSPMTSSGHVISERYRKLMDGDFTEPSETSDKKGVASASAAVKQDTLNVERENSFDSGVEFVMHL